jgi:hypothetical protein
MSRRGELLEAVRTAIHDHYGDKPDMIEVIPVLAQAMADVAAAAAPNESPVSAKEFAIASVSVAVGNPGDAGRRPRDGERDWLVPH